MSNARGKSVDTTYLSLETAEERGFIHRDYIAHCLRWSHVIKWLQDGKTYEDLRILDVGCGRELPLPTTLYSSRFIVGQYYGVDYGPINDTAMGRFHTGAFPLKVYEKTDIMDISLSDLDGHSVDCVTCFEVLEHVEPEHVRNILVHLLSLLRTGGTAFFSTPCWDLVSCAANHVNEMKFGALAAVFEDCGWTVRNVWGTFASLKDYWHQVPPEFRDIKERLRSYYDVNLLACIFAPMFPHLSRNCLWELTPRLPSDDQQRKYPRLSEIPTPWSSSEKWQGLETVASTTPDATPSDDPSQV